MIGISASAHGHLWVLADGTPVHAPPGRLTRNDHGQVCCHLCGNWFDHLGAHLRRHGWSAAGYRQAVGLAAGRALCNEALSGAISTRQARRWRADPQLRTSFDAGRETGIAVLVSADRDRRMAQESKAVNARNLSETRARRDQERRCALAELARDAGVGGVDALLRHRYENGDSLSDLQRLTGWSRPRVRAALHATGATIRPSGHTTAGGRANRARILEARVVARIGTTDVDGWLQRGRERGLTTAQLAGLTGRSDTWVRTRLAAGAFRSRGTG